MSTGGNVPNQGVVVQEATTAKKRGDRGQLGDGSPGGRLKAAWRSGKSKLSLRAWIRDVSTKQVPDLAEDAKLWLESKRYRGGKTTLQARKDRAERIRTMYAARPAKSGKGNMNVPKKETSRMARR